MILQSLVQLYDRLAAAPATRADLPQRGTSVQNIAFSIVIDLAGNRVAVRDEREQSGKKRVARSVLVPGGGKPSGAGFNANYLWDQPTYLLGFCPDATNAKKRERAPKEFATFKEVNLAVEQEVACPEFFALCRFLEKHDPAAVDADPELQFLRTEKVTGFGAFRIAGRTEWLHDTPAIRAWWERHLGAATSDDTPKGDCLITEAHDVALARLHEPKIKGVAGAQSSGAAIVSFNCDAFTSYGKDQSFNAPVSELAAFKYATALNWLLDGPLPQRLRIGDTTVVFWTEKPTQAESLLGALLGGQPANDPAAQDATLNLKLEAFLNVLRQGGGSTAVLKDDLTTPFFILGLAPNAARIAIRFWYTSTLGELLQHLKRHCDDLAIQKEYPDSDMDFPPIWLLLKETARTSDDIPPLLGGALTRAILTGGPYPQSFATAVLRRIRIDAADGERRTHVSYLRAALLKAFLNRNSQQSIPMSLDPENPDVPYRLGRLFAALEKTQRDALGDTNTSVRERFYASASATPGPVFPRILRTYTHHLAKLEGGLKVVREQLVQEILDPIAGSFPAALNLEEQGRFAIGYYHQMRAFFTKRADSASSAKATAAS
ncbi:MAG TPA: type I-C CRISPR-associated protein Cas8c/Csd1 [Opitutaceae bacterium]|nr:type I-C CRISPR-associated protein Cas8c/Csd1 [Opitutaceae bacterium]